MRAGRRGFAACCGLLVLATLLLTGLGLAGFSDGKADAAREGCGPQAGCHGVPGQASSLVLASLAGLPEAYEPGARYDLTVRIEGAPQPLPAAVNQGGFALEVTAGSLEPIDASVQVLNGTAATHTEEGNDQRSWQLAWLAPSPPAGEVSVFLSVNAVNGNGFADPADLWTRIEVKVRPGAAEPAPPPPPPGPEGSQTMPPPGEPRRGIPATSGLAAALALALAAGLSGRRGPRP